jgi:hypothetical protein
MRSFSELAAKEKVAEVLRWICVLPVAVLCQRVGDVVTYGAVVFPFLSELSYEGPDRWLRHLIGRFLGGAIFVVAGAKTAPRFRLVTAAALAMYSIVVAVQIHWFPHRDDIPIVAQAVAVACGLACLGASEKSQGRPEQRAQPTTPASRG